MHKRSSNHAMATPPVLSNSIAIRGWKYMDLKEEILEAVTNDAVLKGQLPSTLVSHVLKYLLPIVL